MKQIHFIVNPISGSGKHKITKELLCRYFNCNQYAIIIKQTQYTGHATELAQDSIKEGAEVIVACGGDGTISEVASCLVRKDIPLGIIPLGSGNGLASHLAISKNIENALKVIKNERIKKIDVGQVNTKYFFSNTGFGFDADVIFNYEKMQKRHLTTYIRAVLKSFKDYKPYDKVDIYADRDHQVLRPFLVFMANSNKLGFNMSFTPNAQLDDGLLDVVIIPKINKFQILYLGLLFLLKKVNAFKHLQYVRARRIILQKKYSNYFLLQKDGERHIIDHDTVIISLSNKSLNVIAPI